MKAILRTSETRVQNSFYNYKGASGYCATGLPETHQEFTVYGDNIEFNVEMISKNGFIIPRDHDVEVEMKFTFIPNTPKSETITLK